MIYNSRTEIEILQWSIVPVVTTINTEIYVIVSSKSEGFPTISLRHSWRNNILI